jgi:hypothetical protein
MRAMNSIKFLRNQYLNFCFNQSRCSWLIWMHKTATIVSVSTFGHFVYFKMSEWRYNNVRNVSNKNAKGRANLYLINRWHFWKHKVHEVAESVSFRKAQSSQTQLTTDSVTAQSVVCATAEEAQSPVTSRFFGTCRERSKQYIEVQEQWHCTLLACVQA